MEKVDSTGRPITYSLYVDHSVEQQAREILELARRRTEDARQFQELAEEQPADTWVATYRSARRRTRLLQASLILNLILSAGLFVLVILVFFFREQRETAFKIKVLSALWESAERILPAGTLGLLALTLLLFLIWLHRVNQNTHALAVRDLSFSPARACGFILIPPVNLIGPFFVMKELWLANQSTDPSESAADYRSRPAPAGVVAWWALTLLWVPFARIGSFLVSRAATKVQLDTGLLFSAFAQLVPVAVFLLTLRMVSHIERLQLRRRDAVNAS